MAEQANVEVVISAFTEAAQEALDSVGDELNNLSADAKPAAAATNEVADELDDATTSAVTAGEAMDDVDAASLAASMSALANRADEAGDEIASAGRKAGVTSGLFSRLTVSAGGLSVAMGTLSSVATLSLIPSLLTLSTLLLPLAGILGGIAAAAGSLAVVFGGLAATGVVTHMKELKTAFAEAKTQIMEIIQPLGQVFGPLLVDAVQALPTLVRRIVAALGPLGQFADGLRTLGQQAMEVIPAMVGVMFDLATQALPVLIDVISTLRSVAGPAMSAVGEAFRRLGPPLMDLMTALGDLLPTLYEIGITVGELVIPALTRIVSVIDTVAQFVAGLDSNLRKLAVAGAITAPAIFSVASSLGTLLGPLGLAAAAVAAFAAAYKSNFLGIQDTVNNAVGGVIAEIRAFWAAHQDVFARIGQVFGTYLDAVRANLRAIQPYLRTIAQNLQGLFANALRIAGESLRMLVPIFEQVIGTLVANRDHFRALAGAVFQAVNGIISILRVLQGVVEFVIQGFIIPLLGELVDVWSRHFGTILDEVAETVAAIRGVVQPALDALADFWDSHGQTIVSTVQTYFDIVITYLGGVLDTLYTIIIVALNLIQGDWDEAWSAIVGLFDRTTDRLASILESLGLGGLMASQGKRVQGALQTYIIQPLQGLVAFSRRWGRMVQRVFSAHFSRLRGLYRTHAAPLVREFKQTWNAIVNNVIRPAVDIITTVIQVALDVILAGVRLFMNVVSALWSTFGDEIITVTEAAWNAVSVIVTTILDGILTAVRVFLNVLQGDWSAAWDAIAGYVDRTISRITGFIEDWATPLWNAFIGVLNGVWTLTTDFWNGLVNWMATPLGMLLTQFEVWGDQLYNVMVTVWNGVVQVVAGATETLINNAISAINAFLSTLDDVADAVSQIPHVDAPDVSQLEDVSVDTSGVTAEQRRINRQQMRQENIAEVRTTLTVEGDSPLADFIRENVRAESQKKDRQQTRRTRRQNPTNQ